jgi:hypothetical protein
LLFTGFGRPDLGAFKETKKTVSKALKIANKIPGRTDKTQLKTNISHAIILHICGERMKMEKRKVFRRWTAGCAAIAFTWMAIGVVSAAQLNTGATKSETTAPAFETAKSDNSENNSFEKEGGKQEIVKKNKFPWFLVACGAVVVGIVVYFVLIKKTNHILVVDIGPGASGTPAAGKYTYKKGEKIAYNFVCADAYKNLTVFIDNIAVAPSGTIVMDRAHGVRVESTELSEYTLYTELSNGISGSPAGGSFRYREGTVVPYQYAAADLALVIKLDNVVVPAAGSFVMDKNHVLKITFGSSPDIRGTWRFTLKDDKETQAKPEVVFSFNGTTASGTFIVLNDLNISEWTSWWGDQGQYAISSNLIELKFTDDSLRNGGCYGYNCDVFYSFIGNFKSSRTMTGTYHYENGGDPWPTIWGNGTWTATRIE